MNCQEARELLFPFQEGALAPPERTAIQAHLAGCDGCRAELDSVASLQGRVRQHLQTRAAQAMAPPVAWSRVQERPEGRPSVDLSKHKCQNLDGGPGAGRRRWMMCLSTRMPRWLPVSIVVLVALVAAFALIPPLRTVAQDPLGIFRVKRFATVTVDPSTLPKGNPDPTGFGALTITQMPNMTSVSSIQEAQALVDFAVRTPRNLPAGMGAPAIRVMKEGRLSYTFDLQKAREYLASMGIALNNMPAGLDGATIKVTIPSQVVAEYRPASGTGMSLMIAQGHSPVLEAPPGLDVNAVRSQLLSMPGLPPELVSQLQSIADWQQTAVIPLPKEGVTSKEVAVDGGMKGLYLQGKAGEGQALLWEKNGVLYAVAGDMTPDQLSAAANSMAP